MTEEQRKCWIESFPPEHQATIALCEPREIDHEIIPVLVVDSPEKWDAANRFSVAMDLQQSNVKRIKIPMTGMSLAKWEEIETSTPIPEVEADEERPQGFDEHRELARVDRRIAILEAATGKSFPGKDQSEKREFYLQRNKSDQDSITIFIDRDLCNFGGSPTMPRVGPLVVRYEDHLADSDAGPATFESFDDWKAASDVQHIYRFQRSGQPFIVEFPLKSVPADLHKQIIQDTKEPEPERVPVINKMTGKFMPGEFEIKRRDPVYLRKVRAAGQKRMVRYFNACLMFVLPGSNEKEMYDWLSQRLVGDVTRIRDYIEDNVMGIGNRYSFFGEG